LGVVEMLEGGLLAHGGAIAAVRGQLRNYLLGYGEITVAQFRELIGSNRKYAMALLGHFDAEVLTKRAGDVRVLLS
ncbi:MAG: SelB C-terminal domain-containing protein, partial [Candidatus Latescibacterota bacterium]|nr:SelB C-terminal domain-containing protein [Candidatus Latescibacterota bacterium]